MPEAANVEVGGRGGTILEHPLPRFGGRPCADRLTILLSNPLVLCYHAVSPDWPAALSVTPQQLESQAGALRSAGYRGATFSDAAQARTGKVVAFTFDDAYRSVLELALPILSRHGFPATVFAPTSFIGTGEPMRWPGIDGWLDGPHRSELVPMDWSELGSLAEAGWEIGSHTHTHPHLTELDDEALADELARSRHECEDKLGRACGSLAYPYGDHDGRVVAATAGAGYSFAGTLPARLHPLEPLRVPRVGIYNVDERVRFRLKTSPILRRLRAGRAWPRR